MIPFDYLITTRLQQKDQFRPCIPVPIDSTKANPVPHSFEPDMPYEGLQTDSLSEYRGSMGHITENFPRGVDTLPAVPSALSGIQPAPINQPSVALGKYNVAGRL